MKILDAKLINNYAQRVLERQTTKLNKEDWNIIASDLLPEHRLKTLIAKKKVMSNIEIANRRILDILAKNNINENTPFELLNEARDIARKKENSSDLIKIAKELVEIQDLKPQKVTISESRQQIDYTNMLPEKTKQTISTTKTVNNDE